MSMTKALELRNPQSCLNKAAPEEPVFVLRANDPTAAQVIRLWADMNAGVQLDDIRTEAYDIANAFEAWNAKLPKVCLPMTNSMTSGGISSQSAPSRLR